MGSTVVLSDKTRIFDSHTDNLILKLFKNLRKMNLQGTRLWEKQIDKDVAFLFNKWDVQEFCANKDAYTGLVLECKSKTHGSSVIKMYPPFLSRRFVKESFIISQLRDYPQATLLDVEPSRNAMLLERIIPGNYIDFEADKKEIAEMFLSMREKRLKVKDVLNIPNEIKGIIAQTEDELEVASKYNYFPKLLTHLVGTAGKIYEKSFGGETKYLLHGDAYYKNALKSGNGIRIIDPVGYVDAFVFEYMPFLAYELVNHSVLSEYRKKYYELVNFFSTFTDTSKFNEATYIFLVKQLVPSVYEANDGYVRANKYMQLIKELFLDDYNKPVL